MWKSYLRNRSILCFCTWTRMAVAGFPKPAIPLQQLDDIPYFHGENSYLWGCRDWTAGHADSNQPLATQPQRMVSIKVTLLISFRVVTPPRTLSSADSRRKRMPSSRAALRISDVGLFSKITAANLWAK